MGRKRKRRLGLARRARSDLPARPFPQAKQPIPYAPPAGLDCAMAGMQKSAQGKFCGDKLRRRARTAISPLGKKLPESGGKKNASMPPKCELPTLPLRRVQTSPAAEMRVADFTAPAGSNFACRRKRDDARESQAAYLGIKSSHARLAKVSTRAGGIFNATKETPKCAIFLKPSDSGERARL